MGSSTSLDRYTQSGPELTANAANAVWDTPSESKEKKAGALTAKRVHPSTSNRQLEPTRDHLDDLINFRKAGPEKRSGGGTRNELSTQNRDLRVQKQRLSRPIGELRSVAFATKAKTKARSPFEILTKHVQELEKERKATKLRMEAIIAEKGVLETKLKAAIDRIQALTKELEKAKRPDKPDGIRRKRDEDGSDSALLSGETSTDRKRKKKRT